MVFQLRRRRAPSNRAGRSSAGLQMRAGWLMRRSAVYSSSPPSSLRASMRSAFSSGACARCWSKGTTGMLDWLCATPARTSAAARRVGGAMQSSSLQFGRQSIRVVAVVEVPVSAYQAASSLLRCPRSEREAHRSRRLVGRFRRTTCHGPSTHARKALSISSHGIPKVWPVAGCQVRKRRLDALGLPIEGNLEYHDKNHDQDRRPASRGR